MKNLNRILTGVLAFICCSSVYSDEIGQITKIDVSEKEVSLYSQGTGWDVSKKVALDKVITPLVIKEKSAMRYKVQIDGQDVWLDRNDVMAELNLTVPGECEPPRQTASASAVTRGLGEPCKSSPPKSVKDSVKKTAQSATKTSKGTKKK